MNCKQRMKNRATAEALRREVRVAEAMKHTCPECGEKGLHWVQMPYTLQMVIDRLPRDGFWTCDKFYGPDGRRIGH